MIKLGIVMDPIANINIKKDSSFAMLLEAQRRGYELHYMEMNDLYLINGEARARTRIVNVEQNYDKWYEFGTEQDIALADLNVILMRKDPPFDTEYIYCTYILERAEEKGTLIVNKPQSLRDCNEKLYTAWFSDLTPETLVTRSKAQLKAFWQKHGDIIMKPLDGMGGASIFRVKEGDPNIGVIAETLTELGTRYCMAQNYIPAIKDGDKRVLVVDGEPVPYCLEKANGINPTELARLFINNTSVDDTGSVVYTDDSGKSIPIGEHIKAWAYKSPWAIKLVQKPGSGQGGSVSSIGNSELRNAFGLK